MNRSENYPDQPGADVSALGGIAYIPLGLVALVAMAVSAIWVRVRYATVISVASFGLGWLAHHLATAITIVP